MWCGVPVSRADTAGCRGSYSLTSAARLVEITASAVLAVPAA
jgi:hypothetical protein